MGSFGAVLFGIATGLAYFVPRLLAGAGSLLQGDVTSAQTLLFALFMVFFLTAPIALFMVSTAVIYSGLRLRRVLGLTAGISGILYAALILTSGFGRDFLTTFGQSSLSLTALLFPLFIAAFLLKERRTFGDLGLITSIAFLAYVGASQLRILEIQFLGALSYFLLAVSLFRASPIPA